MGMSIPRSSKKRKWLRVGLVGVTVSTGIWIAYYVNIRNREGKSLPESCQQILKPYFPTLDLSKVRVVIGDYLPSYAWAFTPIYDLMVIRPEYWKPETATGLSMIANELTHIAQWERLGLMFLPTFLYQRFVYGLEKGSIEEESTRMQKLVYSDLISKGYLV